MSLLFLVRVRSRSGGTLQIAVEDAAELRASVGELEDARFNVEIFDAAGRQIERWNLPPSEVPNRSGWRAPPRQDADRANDAAES